MENANAEKKKKLTKPDEINVHNCNKLSILDEKIEGVKEELRKFWKTAKKAV